MSEKKWDESVRGIANELQRDRKFKFQRRVYKIYSINDLIELDLAEFSASSKYSGGYKYLLVLVVVFTKKTFAEKLKTKTANEVLEATKKLLKRAKYHFKNVYCDRGDKIYF